MTCWLHTRRMVPPVPISASVILRKDAQSVFDTADGDVHATVPKAIFGFGPVVEVLAHSKPVGLRRLQRQAQGFVHAFQVSLLSVILDGVLLPKSHCMAVTASQSYQASCG